MTHGAKRLRLAGWADTRGQAVRILYLIDSTGVGGAEVLLLDLMAEAIARGHEAHLAYFTPGPLGPRLSALAASTTRLSRHGLTDPLAVWRTYRLIRKLRPDVVHSHLTKSDLVGQSAAWLAAVPRRFATLHNTDRWRGKRHLALVYRVATAAATRVIAVSDAVADHAHRTGSVSKARLQVIGNGVDVTRFAGIAPLAGQRKTGPARFAIVGRLEAQKDHRSFLQAARRVLDRGHAVHFRIIGDGSLRPELEALSARLDLGLHVTFVGVVPDIAASLAEIDALVLSSAWEGMPVAVLEAMAAARPVVVTDVGALAQVVRPGIDGLIVPPGDPEALAGAMIAILSDPDRARAMGLSGRARVGEHFTAAAMRARVFALYDDG